MLIYCFLQPACRHVFEKNPLTSYTSTRDMQSPLFPVYLLLERVTWAAIDRTTEIKGQSSEHDWHLAKLRYRREEGIHVLYCDGSLKLLVGRTVSAEMLHCMQATVKTSCWHEAFVLCMMEITNGQPCLNLQGNRTLVSLPKRYVYQVTCVAPLYTHEYLRSLGATHLILDEMDQETVNSKTSNFFEYHSKCHKSCTFDNTIKTSTVLLYTQCEKIHSLQVINLFI